MHWRRKLKWVCWASVVCVYRKDASSTTQLHPEQPSATAAQQGQLRSFDAAHGAQTCQIRPMKTRTTTLRTNRRIQKATTRPLAPSHPTSLRRPSTAAHRRPYRPLHRSRLCCDRLDQLPQTRPKMKTLRRYRGPRPRCQRTSTTASCCTCSAA